MNYMFVALSFRVSILIYNHIVLNSIYFIKSGLKVQPNCACNKIVLMSKQIQSISKHIFNKIREKGKNFKTQTRKQSQNMGLILNLKTKQKKKPKLPRKRVLRLAILNNVISFLSSLNSRSFRTQTLRKRKARSLGMTIQYDTITSG